MNLRRWMCGLVVMGMICGAKMAPAQTPSTIVPDVVYGHKDGLAMTLDVIQPTDDANGAAIVFVVSGGWVSSWTPPEQFAEFFDPYLAKGFCVFVVRHGSSPRYGIPDAVSDMRRAIRFIRLNAAEYGVDAERLGVLGMSAGGHLALMLATTADEGIGDSRDPIERVGNQVRAVAALVPPSDLRIMVWEAEESLPAYRNFPALNMTVEQAATYSPLLHVSPDDAPALIISGTQDDLVPAKHGEWIANAYQEHDVPCQLLLLDTGHGLQGHQPEAFETVVAWFEKHLLED